MSHKFAKQAALQKLMDLMDEHESEGLKGLKGKPVEASISVTKVPESNDESSPSDFAKTWASMKGKEPDAMNSNDGSASDDEGAEGDGEDNLSDDEKQKISDLYHKHVAKRG